MMTGKLEKRISLELKESLLKVNKHYMNLGCNLEDLEKQCTFKGLFSISKTTLFFIPIFMSFLLYELDYFVVGFNYLLGVRCIVPNNYFIWEATRPITDCTFCSNTLEPIILSNITKNDFLPYAYSSKPIVIKRAFLHWPAIQIFSLEYFQNLYRKTEDSFKSVDEECQFLHFKSDFMSLRDVLSMSKERSKNSPSEKSWYVGWGNCHPVVLEKMRKHYPKPHFLPDDCEIPSKEYVFMGYDDGATMHLDFINRLMWQAQLKGSKVWNLHPPPECESICKPFSFTVEPGDAAIIETIKLTMIGSNENTFLVNKTVMLVFSTHVAPIKLASSEDVLDHLHYLMKPIQNKHCSQTPELLLFLTLVQFLWTLGFGTMGPQLIQENLAFLYNQSMDKRNIFAQLMPSETKMLPNISLSIENVTNTKWKIHDYNQICFYKGLFIDLIN